MKGNKIFLKYHLLESIHIIHNNYLKYYLATVSFYLLYQMSPEQCIQTRENT